MWEFFDKLVNVVLPRVKDFRGLSAKSFDKQEITLSDWTTHNILEIDLTMLQRLRLEVTIVTTAKDAKSGKSF
jgi:large subunit ribosomal protein L5